MTILAIDPGCDQSAWVLYNAGKVLGFGKEPNAEVRLIVSGAHTDTEFAIESVASYGMPVGAEVFETCVWTGRFLEAWDRRPGHKTPRRIYRRDVKLHLCGQPRAKDTNIIHAIYDRYGGSRKAAVGVKAAPGPLYGMKADCWQALGVAITAAETRLAA